MITLPPTINSTARKSRSGIRKEVHLHADRYLEKLEEMSSPKICPKINSGVSFIIKYAEAFSKGLEVMFKSIKIG